MFKNLLILILAVACGGLGYLHFGVPKPQPVAEPVAPVETTECDCPAPVIEDIEKITMVDAILAAPAHDLSLDTPLENVDELLKEAGYECKKNDSRVSQDSAENRKTSWQCENTSYKSSLYVSAVGEDIQKITRNGIATMQDMENTLDQLDSLKVRLAGRENVDIIQNKKTVMFRLTNENEDKSKSYADYRFHFNQHKDEENPKVNYDGKLTVNLVR